VDAAVRILRQHYGSYVVVAAVAAVPSLLANLLLLRDTSWGTDLAAMAAQDPFSGPRLWATLVGFVTYLLAEGVYVRLTADAYQGGPVSVADAAAHALPRAPLVVLGQIVRFIGVGIGSVLLFIPGMIVLVRTAVAAQATVLEDEGAIGGLSRSWSLSKGHAWRVLGGIGLAWLLFFVVMMGLQMLGGIVGAIVGGATAFLAVMLVLSAFGSVLIYPIIPIVSTLMYYDLRVRREGLDLELMADDLGAAAPARP